MQAKRVIPCLDIRDGRVVKGVRFESIRDAGDPVEFAQHYERDGADELALFDITASAEGRATTLEVVRQVAEHITIPLTVGGGVSDLEVIEKLLEAGASKVSINTAAVDRPEFLKEAAERFGTERIVLAIDARRQWRQDGALWWEVTTHGGRRFTGMDVVEWAKRAVELGASELVLNSIDADGTRDGYDNELNRTVAEAVDVPVIASGGVGNLQHLVDGILIGKADGVLAASIFHFGEYSVSEAKAYLRAHGIPVRM